MLDVRRREFITLLGGAAAWPIAARAQQPTPVIGYVSNWASDGIPRFAAGFQQGLKETGLVEGRDFAIEYHSTGDQIDRLPAIVADVVARRVTVILVVSDTYALAVKAATTAIPIVYIGGNDPVRIGLVASLNRPGGNVTGVTVLNVEIAAKRLQLLNELMPTTQAIAALLDPGTPNFEIDFKKLGSRRPTSWLASSYCAGSQRRRGWFGVGGSCPAPTRTSCGGSQSILQYT